MRVYIHVPFCARRCSYCDFAIAVRAATPNRDFADAIGVEWNRRRREPPWSDATALRSVYFGGGTPSRLAPEALGGILELLCETHPLPPDAEVTLETNPDDVTPDRASAWHALGINRVSLGVQSFEAKVLDWMHRTHTAEQVGPAMEMLRGAGFDNVSLDLIYGLPDSVERNWERDLERAMDLDPQHLSLYALTVEDHTPLAHWRRRGEEVEAPEERTAEEFLMAHRRITAAGFEHYEVSNAGRPGFRSQHNHGYWTGDAFLGLGPSAHSGWGGGVGGRDPARRRAWNIREWEAYQRAVAAGGDPRVATEELSSAQALLEDRYLGLRTSRGVSRGLVPDGTRALWVEQGWAEDSAGECLRLTPEGWLRLDALVSHLPDDS